MAQKIQCPICKAILIANEDLVIDDKIEFDYEKIKETDKEVKIIKCHNCKRRIKYYIDR